MARFWYGGDWDNDDCDDDYGYGRRHHWWRRRRHHHWWGWRRHHRYWG